MPIQTQKFTPLKQQHYKLAITQSELDEEAKRKIALQNNAAGHAAGLANMRQSNANNRLAATQGLRREENAAAQKQTDIENTANQEQADINNGLNQRQADRLDANDAANAEQTTYNRKQDGLNRTRQQKLDSQNDYRFGRQQEEDKRNDVNRQKKKQSQNRALALGTVGELLSRNISNDNVNDKGLVDLSEAKDVLPVLINGYEFRGK
ncbi:hypothetical protein, partial [uncultured Paraglaciecola sp.]|uniref:hypothetical protein n=1 Tax=uncultured Paraglaciecola sp. TaxID=1765024 RepID=UPI0025D16F3E